MRPDQLSDKNRKRCESCENYKYCRDRSFLVNMFCSWYRRSEDFGAF